MSVRRLVLKEILHRKLNFVLGLSSVIVAVACLVGALTLLRAHDVRTEQILARKQAETDERMLRLEDDYRKITKRMGFNVLILPKGQSADFWEHDSATRHMPEEYADRLAESGVMTVRHLLPSLQQKIKWRERTIILVGVRGEVPLAHRDPKKPILAAVPPGGMIVGYELHRSLGLSAGDRVELRGREFTVARLHEERGTKDDVTVWIDLEEAQELLDKKGLINGILALQCYCEEGEPLGRVREEITRILPETEVIEFASKILVRAEARGRAAAEAREAVGAEKKNRARLRAEREAFAAILVPVVILGASVWVGFLSLVNVRERRGEIGILRALGLRSRQILSIFLLKALLLGFLGALVGYAAGLAVGAFWGELPPEAGASTLFDPVLALLVVMLAPVLSGLASWMPGVIAAQEDPAAVLSEEGA